MRAELSTMTALKQVVGRSLYANFHKLCPDQREIFQTAARFLEISEVEMMIKIADRLKLPVLTRLTDDFQFVEVPGITRKEHLEGAFVLFRSKTGFYGCACLNPAWLTPYTSRFSQFPTLLAPWGIVKSWTQKQEPKIPKQNTLCQILSIKCHSSLSAENTIDAIIETVSSFSVRAAALQFMPDSILYEIIGSDLCTHRGKIKTKESERVEEIFALSFLKYPHRVERKINGTKVSITVSPNPLRRKFHIQWVSERTKAANDRDVSLIKDRSCLRREIDS